MDVLEKIAQEVKEKMNNDPAHDFAHIMRVYNNAKKICKDQDVPANLVLTAVLLHDIIKDPKNSKDSSQQSANEARRILAKYNFSADDIDIICDAILTHSFSQNKNPTTLVGKILQDADRLDALGAVGIARTFTVGGFANRPLYNPLDPFCTKRQPDDKRWTVDHFFTKLLCLEDMMYTTYAKKEARRRTNILRSFLSQLQKEL